MKKLEDARRPETIDVTSADRKISKFITIDMSADYKN